MVIVQQNPLDAANVMLTHLMQLFPMPGRRHTAVKMHTNTRAQSRYTCELSICTGTSTCVNTQTHAGTRQSLGHRNNACSTITQERKRVRERETKKV